MTVTGSEDVTKGGLFFFDGEFFFSICPKPSAAQLDELRAAGWLKPGSRQCNAGIYCFTRRSFNTRRRWRNRPEASTS